MRDIWYLVLPLIISALITPVVKQIGYRLDAFAQMMSVPCIMARSCASAA